LQGRAVGQQGEGGRLGGEAAPNPGAIAADSRVERLSAAVNPFHFGVLSATKSAMSGPRSRAVCARRRISGGLGRGSYTRM